MSRTSNVQTLFVSASVLALAVSARPISDPNVLTNLGSQARQVSFSLLQPLNPFSHPAPPVAESNAEENKEGNDNNNTNITDNDDDQSPASVLERLIRLAGQAPGRLVESWTQKHEAAAAAVHVDDDATIFVFAAPETPVDASGVKPEPVLVIPPGSGAPVEVVFTDAPAITHNKALATDAENATAQQGDKKATPGGKALTNAQMQPLVATTMLALLSLGVILAIVAIYHALNLATKSRKITLEDVEANNGDSKPPAAPVDLDEKAVAELAEKVLSLMPPPMPRARSPFPRPRTPRMIPLPEPSADEFDEKQFLMAELSRSPSPYLTPAELDGMPGEYFPDPEELELLIDVAAQTVPQMQLGSLMRPEPVPVLPLQIALLFPYLNDGWVLRFFVVLFGWWSMMLSPRRS